MADFIFAMFVLCVIGSLISFIKMMVARYREKNEQVQFWGELASMCMVATFAMLIVLDNLKG